MCISVCISNPPTAEYFQFGYLLIALVTFRKQHDFFRKHLGEVKILTLVTKARTEVALLMSVVTVAIVVRLLTQVRETAYHKVVEIWKNISVYYGTDSTHSKILLIISCPGKRKLNY